VPDRPKVLAPIRGTPFLDYLLRHLRAQGCTNVILSTGYRGESIHQFVGTGGKWRVNATCVREPEPLGTGGALRYIRDILGIAIPFLAINGDTYFSGSLEQLVSVHQNKEARATIALTRVEQSDRYGTVAVTDSGQISAFVEKQHGSTGPAWINAGTYVLEPQALESVAPGRATSLESEVFPKLIGHGLCGHQFTDVVFLDIGTPDDFERAGDVLSAAGDFGSRK
jgi:NDP-sugar pyrophosphorylase family protein